MSLPIIETLNNDLSAYIATNVISITDEQLYLDFSLLGQDNVQRFQLRNQFRELMQNPGSCFQKNVFSTLRNCGQIRQEQDSANKSEGYNFRFSKFKKFLAALVQRSAQNKFLSSQLLLGIHLLSSLSLLYLGYTAYKNAFSQFGW